MNINGSEKVSFVMFKLLAALLAACAALCAQSNFATSGAPVQDPSPTPVSRARGTVTATATATATTRVAAANPGEAILLVG